MTCNDKHNELINNRLHSDLLCTFWNNMDLNWMYNNDFCEVWPRDTTHYVACVGTITGNYPVVVKLAIMCFPFWWPWMDAMCNQILENFVFIVCLYLKLSEDVSRKKCKQSVVALFGQSFGWEIDRQPWLPRIHCLCQWKQASNMIVIGYYVMNESTSDLQAFIAT